MKYLIVTLLSFSTPCFSQISDFKGFDVQSQQTISLSDFSNKKAIAIVFTSNVCPYSVYYEGRITQLIAEFSNEVQFILINSHSDTKESSSEMKNKLSAWGLSIPYIADKDGAIKKIFNARKSPEVYLLNSRGSTFSIFYKGAIDNNPQVASDVKNRYLKKNVESLLSGRPSSTGSTRPIGCIIK